MIMSLRLRIKCSARVQRACVGELTRDVVVWTQLSNVQRSRWAPYVTQDGTSVSVVTLPKTRYR